MLIRCLLLALNALLTLAGLAPAAAQAPVASPGASPVAGGFVLVATIGADAWHEPLPEPGVDLGDRSLLDALREGGFVIYFRHAATDTAVDQDVDFRYCSTQRNLSQLGKDQSAEIGAGFAELGIPVGEVRSSEFCRTRETAELAFGRVEVDPMLTPLPEDSPEEKAAKAEAFAALLSTPPEARTNTVVVGHQANIASVLQELELDEGEAAVFLPVG